MRTLLIRGGRLLDPSRDLDRVGDLWIAGGRFAADDFTAGPPDEIIDAGGLIVMPGLVDVHVHLREPGNEAAETIETGCAAALAGGFTSIICMPNTTPALDTPERLQRVLRRADSLQGPRVHVMGAITRGRRGKEIAPLEELAAAGAVAFTDDGNGVQDEDLLRRAMERAAALGRPIAEHCEKADLTVGGVVHDGPAAMKAGLPGIPAEAEWRMVERDVALAQATGAALHIQHVSAGRSLAPIREAKARGARVTAEATPHHLTLTDEEAVAGGPDFKMNPPLRTRFDREALREAARDGTLDIIATDHAPHTERAKAGGMMQAPFGVIGMETAAAVVWTCLVGEGVLTPLQMAARMSTRPARAFGLEGGSLSPGAPRDVTLFDPAAEWTVDPREFRSRSRNCPFAGWNLRGRVAATVVAGEVLFRSQTGGAV